MDKIVELNSYLEFTKNELKELKKQMYDDYQNGKYDENKREYWGVWNQITGKEKLLKQIKKYITFLKNKELYGKIQMIDNQ
jgi:hypothetical protein